ncbi:MAG: hypothetical protein FWF03_03610 [Defluviitaleaceae bacterium]|nr:hypothetical protein [Defluviitaleaceae bacterium]
MSRAKKKAERQMEGRIPEIICLCCFQKFTHDKAVFRAAESAAAPESVPDARLEAYYKIFGSDAPLNLPPVILPQQIDEREKTYRKVALVSVSDTNGRQTSRRLCPSCHNQLHRGAAFSKCDVIAVVGAPRSGCASYFTSLIRTLKTSTPRNFNAFCAPLRDTTGSEFKSEYEITITETGRTAVSEGDGFRLPMVFSFAFTDGQKSEMAIAYFEKPGLDSKNAEYAEIYKSYVKNSAAVIYLLDSVRNKRGVNHPDYSEDPANYFSRLAAECLNPHAGVPSQIPAAVVLTKADALEAGEPEAEEVRGAVFNNYTHRDFFDLTEFDGISAASENYILKNDPNFHAALAKRFERRGFFAVSALGAEPGTIRQRGASYAPARADEPFLWILYELGYIGGFRR